VRFYKKNMLSRIDSARGGQASREIRQAGASSAASGRSPTNPRARRGVIVLLTRRAEQGTENSPASDAYSSDSSKEKQSLRMEIQDPKSGSGTAQETAIEDLAVVHRPRQCLATPVGAAIRSV
jgi:hypothetical protein